MAGALPFVRMAKHCVASRAVVGVRGLKGACRLRGAEAEHAAARLCPQSIPGAGGRAGKPAVHQADNAQLAAQLQVRGRTRGTLSWAQLACPVSV